MPTIQELESKRDAVLQEMRAIRSMKRGSISEQYLKVRHQGIKEPVTRGPYHVFSRHEPRTGKTVSWRLTSKEAIERARADISSYQRFVALCREYQDLTETLGELEGSLSERGTEKKRRRLSSNRMQK
jgi:hypothetical protein